MSNFFLNGKQNKARITFLQDCLEPHMQPKNQAIISLNVLPHQKGKHCYLGKICSF